MSVTAYQVVVGNDPDDLNTKVAAAISNSWAPFGAPFLAHNLPGKLLQPMIQGSQVLVGATGATGATGTTGTTGATGASAAVQTFYGETSSAANTYAVTITGATLATGNIFAIKFDHAPTAAATLNINGLGAKAIVLPNGAALSGTQGVDGQTNWMVYDGTKLVLAITPNSA